MNLSEIFQKRVDRGEFLKGVSKMVVGGFTYSFLPKIPDLSKLTLNTSPGWGRESTPQQPTNESSSANLDSSEVTSVEGFPVTFVNSKNPNMTTEGLCFTQNYDNPQDPKIFVVLDNREVKMLTAFKELNGTKTLITPTSNYRRGMRGEFLQDFIDRLGNKKTLRVESDINGNIKSKDIVDVQELLSSQNSTTISANTNDKPKFLSEIKKQEIELLGAVDMKTNWPFLTPNMRYTYQGVNTDTGTPFQTTITVGQAENYSCTMNLPPTKVFPVIFNKNHKDGYPFQGDDLNLVWYVSTDFLRLPDWPDDFICALGDARISRIDGRMVKKVTYRSPEPLKGPAYGVCPKFLKITGAILDLPQQNYYHGCNDMPYYGSWLLSRTGVQFDSAADSIYDIQETLHYEEGVRQNGILTQPWAIEDWTFKSGKLIRLDVTAPIGKRCTIWLVKEEKIGV